MTLSVGPNLGQLEDGAPGEAHYAELVRQWRAIDALVQANVISRVAALPTSGQVNGDKYILTATANIHKIARWTTRLVTPAWEYFTPKNGWSVWVTDEAKGYTLKAGAWAVDSAVFTGGTLSSALNEAPQVTIASSATVAIGAAVANTINISGTTSITGFDTIPAGAKRTLIFQGALTLTHNATSLILPGNANVLTVADDSAEFVSLGSGNWKCLDYRRATGAPLAGLSNPMTAAGDIIIGGVAGVPSRLAPGSTGSELTIVNGAPVWAVAPAFSAGATAATTLATSVATKVNFQTEEYDTGSNFASSRFTAPVAGRYKFQAAVALTTNVATVVLSFYKNGSLHKRFSASGVGAWSGVVDIPLVATDYVEVYFTQNAATQDTVANPVFTFFQGSLEQRW